MSSRAAVRLEDLGFGRVYEFSAGKKGWLAAGLPAEGEQSGSTRAGDLARPGPPTCDVETTVGELRDRNDMEEWGCCVITDDDDVVHGLLTPGSLEEAAADTRVTDVMETGPTTIRPSASLDSALDRMDGAGVDFLLVTTEFGVLLGILLQSDVKDHVDGDDA